MNFAQGAVRVNGIGGNNMKARQANESDEERSDSELGEHADELLTFRPRFDCLDFYTWTRRGHPMPKKKRKTQAPTHSSSVNEAHEGREIEHHGNKEDPCKCGLRSRSPALLPYVIVRSIESLLCYRALPSLKYQG